MVTPLRPDVISATDEAYAASPRVRDNTMLLIFGFAVVLIIALGYTFVEHRPHTPLAGESGVSGTAETAAPAATHEGSSTSQPVSPPTGANTHSASR